jgi:hypothetical protein
LDETELRPQLEKLAGQMAEQFDIRSDFRDNGVYLSGSAIKRGTVCWTADMLSIELTLKMVGKIFKHQIKDEIDKKLSDIVAT